MGKSLFPAHKHSWCSLHKHSWCSLHKHVPVAAEHGVRHPHTAWALIVHQDALWLRAVVVGPGVLAVNVFRVTQKEKRHYSKEGVPHRVYAALST